MNRKSFLKLAALALALVPCLASANDNAWNQGAVYTTDNSASANHVLAYHRAANGTLSPAGSFETGGVGTGGGLGNQGAVVLSRNGRWIFVCNAGSDEISVLRVTPHGLYLTDKIGSRGKRPISLALHRNLLYVLNAGGQAGDTDNVTAFLFFAGRLYHCPGSTRSLSGDDTSPAQISFSNGGDVLVVTEKGTSIIDTFTVGDDGLVEDHKMFTSPVPTPFGFAVSRQGRIFVSEANGGAADVSSVASYEVSDDGDLTGLSGSVPTTESAACLGRADG